MVPILALLLVLTGCGGTARPAPEPAPAPAPVSRYPHTEADARFMTAMIGHHAQALVMAALAPTNGANPEVQRLAERIESGQRDEIGLMQQWLRVRDLPVPDPEHAAHEGHLMHGMLTEGQLRELATARGPQFDRLFLTYMIQHHRGAVQMVKELYGTPGAAQDETVFEFADDVGVDQMTEIARMERMLATLPESKPSS